MTTEILVRFRTDDEMKNKDLVRLKKKLNMMLANL